MKYTVVKRLDGSGWSIYPTDITDVTTPNKVFRDRFKVWTQVLVTNVTLSGDKQILAVLIHAMELFQEHGND